MANQKSAVVNELDLEIPVDVESSQVEAAAPAASQELPVIEDDSPAVVAPEGDMPALDQ